MVSADAGESSRELGSKYVYTGMMPAGYEPWYTDIIRIERFTRTLSPLPESKMLIDVFAPNVPRLVVYHFDLITGERTEVPVIKAADYPGWWTVTVMKDGDYLGTTESPCPVQPPAVANRDPNSPATCDDTNPGARCALLCASGFVPSGDGYFTCSLGKWSTQECVAAKDYSPEVPVYRLTHRSRLDYGWRIRQLYVYSDSDCTAGITDVKIVGTSGDYEGYPMTNLVDAGDYKAAGRFASPFDLVDETTCVENAAACQDWWSQGLNVNPYEVDETHGEAAYVDFTVPKSADVQCVKVVSRSLGPGAVPRQARQRAQDRGLRALRHGSQRLDGLLGDERGLRRLHGPNVRLRVQGPGDDVPA